MIHIFDTTVLITETGIETDPPIEPEAPPAETNPTDQLVPITELRKVRAEAAENRKRAQKLEADLQKIKDDQEKAKKDAELAKLEETDRLKKINDDLQAKYDNEKKQRERVQKESRLVNLALQMKIKAPALAIKQIDFATLDLIDPTDEEALRNSLQNVIDENEKFGIPIVMTETPPANNVQTPPGAPPANPSNPKPPPGPKLTVKENLDEMKGQYRQVIVEKGVQSRAAMELMQKINDAERATKPIPQNEGG